MTDFISREAVLKGRNELLCHDVNCNDCPFSGYGAHPVCELSERISNISAADVAPAVHGRWIKSPECPEEYDVCDVCGLNDKHRSRGDAEHPALESIPPFCKWCGAKMDGGDDE